MSRLLLFCLLLFCGVACNCPTPPQVSLPPGKTGPRPDNIVVSIDEKQEFYLGNRKVDNSLIDSFLILEIYKRKELADTAVVVINADTSSLYGNVFRIMQAAKRGGAKVVANIK